MTGIGLSLLNKVLYDLKTLNEIALGTLDSGI